MSVDPKSNYYDQGGHQVNDVIRAKLTPEQYRGWLLGNVIKYSGRANWKGTFERDVEKITVYSGLLREFNEEDPQQEEGEEEVEEVEHRTFYDPEHNITVGYVGPPFVKAEIGDDC